VAGKVSGGLEMIDFDCAGEKFAWWKQLVELKAPGLVERLVIERSPSGGWHVVLRHESEVFGNLKLAERAVVVPSDHEVALYGKNYKPRKVGDHWEVWLTLIETRGEGGIFLCDPTPGYELVQGRLDSLPVLTEEQRFVLLDVAWSLNELPRHVEPASTPAGSYEPNGRPGDDFNERGDVRALLRKHGWTLVKGGDNEYWRRPGKSAGTSATLKDGVLYVFSSNAAPFEPNQAYSPFRVFTLLEHRGDYSDAASALRAAGFGDPSPSQPITETPQESPPTGNTQPDPGPFPEHLLDVPGLIGDIMQFNLATAFRPQPVLALAAALCLQAVLAARKVRDDRGNRTNLYAIGVAPSGAGKDHARKINKQILFLAGLNRHDGSEDLASDAGLISAAESEPAILFQIDEFGRFLRTIGDPKKAPHLFNVLTALMRLYSSADVVFRGKAYADKRRSLVIDQPCVSLYGTTVPEHFYESLTADSVNDGCIARLLVFEASATPPRRRASVQDVPMAIVDAARWWADFKPSGNLNSEHPEPAVVPTTPQAAAVFDQLAGVVDHELSQAHNGQRALWARVEEKACRLALVYACSANREQPQIDEAAARWACELSEYLTRRMLFLAYEWVADGQFDAKQKRVKRIIRQAGGRISRSELCRKTQSLTQRERQEVLDNLRETGQVRESVVQTKGRSRVEYELCG
jgi:hypothetical protein